MQSRKQAIGESVDGEPRASSGRLGENGKTPEEHDDESCEGKFAWWRDNPEYLCSNLPLTPVPELVAGAPLVQQWWDVESITESACFVGVLKPPGIFVDTHHR